MIYSRHLSGAVAAFFAVVVAVTFHQILTNMTDQGIASGGPYDNAAAYPRAVAVAIAVLVAAQLLFEFIADPAVEGKGQPTPLADLKRPVLLLVVFAVYLNLLAPLGYHLTTAPMILCIMWICGDRRFLQLCLTSLAMAFAAAFVFEKVMNVVLPGGFLSLNIPW